MHQSDRTSMQVVPSLSEDKLKEFLTEFCNLTLSKEELSNPKPESMSMIYETFLKDFGFNVENLSQPYWQAAELLDSNVENYEEIFAIANLYGLMKQVAERSGIHDFTFKDILGLKRKRARRVLSYLANHWQFSACQLQKWLKIKHEFTTIAERKRELRQELDEKMDSVYKGNLYLNEVESQRVEMDEQCEKCIALLMKENERKEAVTETYHAMKQKRADVKRDLNSVIVEVSSLHERKKELEAKIVSHDQRKELEELAQKSQLYRQKKEEIFSGIDEYNNLRGFHLRISSEVDIISELLDNTNEATTRNRQVLSEIDILRGTMKADEEEVNKLRKQCEQKCLESKALEEWNQKEEMKYIKKRDEIKKLVIQQESYMEDLQKKTGTAELAVEKENLLKCMKDQAAKREKFEQALESKYLLAIENIQKFIKGTRTNIQNMEDLCIIPS